jgi:hypothetical protein
MSARWLVERTKDNFEDVGAAGFEVLDCGALEFVDDDGRLTLLIAPGQWLTVCEEQE